MRFWILEVIISLIQNICDNFVVNSENMSRFCSMVNAVHFCWFLSQLKMKNTLKTFVAGHGSSCNQNNRKKHWMNLKTLHQNWQSGEIIFVNSSSYTQLHLSPISLFSSINLPESFASVHFAWTFDYMETDLC